jgi:short-subunit dehydrogenase
MTSLPALDPHRLVVLGAGPGLGASIARRFGREGFAVTLVSRREGPLTALAEELRDTGVKVETRTADAADPQGFRRALEELADDVSPGVVVYNAAFRTSDDILTSGADHLLTTHAVNVLGAVTAAQVFTPAMRRARSGTVLVTGGGLGLAPHPDFASMSLGKVGLRAAASILHDELADDGVHVAVVTIAGRVIRGTPFDPDRIADTYWAVHAQPVGDRSAETVFDGR